MARLCISPFDISQGKQNLSNCLRERSKVHVTGAGIVFFLSKEDSYTKQVIIECSTFLQSTCTYSNKEYVSRTISPLTTPTLTHFLLLSCLLFLYCNIPYLPTSSGGPQGLEMYVLFFFITAKHVAQGLIENKSSNNVANLLPNQQLKNICI